MMRHKTNTVMIGKVMIGSEHPVVVQSMTDTPTADAAATVEQIKELSDAGSEIVRITVNTEAAAKAVPEIVKRLRDEGYTVPVVGDFHYNGHLLLTKYPDCARALDKLRINPGNSKDDFFKAFIDIAVKYDKPVRIGVNAGSLDQNILNELMKNNSQLPSPKTSNEVLHEALVLSTLNSAKLAESYGLSSDKIVLSAKVSDVQDLIKVNQMLAERSSYPIHIGLTEAGIAMKGLVASSSALAILLQQGIGDTIRVSITPQPGSSRSEEVYASQYVLQSLGIRKFKPTITSCPGCGRTKSDRFQRLSKDMQDFIDENSSRWRETRPGAENIIIAVMGCIVNGPGESKHANIGISFPGDMEDPRLPVYVDGKMVKVLQGDYETIRNEFQIMVENYISCIKS